MKKRFLSLILAIVMVIGMAPAMALTASATDTVEAKWGASDTSLTNSGTLAAAINAAEADSNIKYIQLQSNVTFASESEGVIASGEFTIDLNGKNVTSDTYTLGVRNSGTKVTFIDTAEADGKVSTTGSSHSAVVVRDGASVIIDGGQFEGEYVVNVNDGSSSVTIKNGVFTSIGTRAINNAGTLVIEGGSFTAGSWSAVCANTSTTIKGGSFTAGYDGTFEYYGGLLDLSEYSEISGISVSNYTSAAVVPGDTTVKLPEGYCFYDSENNVATSLAVNTKYTVGEGEATGLVIEAKWGASADALTGSGTLEAAIAAAEADSNIKYIQLQGNVTFVSELEGIIASGEFTIDLNGKNVTSDTYTFTIRNSGTKVTFIDTADTDGKVSSTRPTASSVNVSNGASVIIDGGKFEGGDAVYVDDSISSATIKSGEFTSIDWRTISNNGTLVIEGGSFTAGDRGTIEYFGGLLDLSEYSEVSGISVYIATSAAVVPGDTTVKLPSGYCFYDSDNKAVASLEVNTKYTVGEGEAPELVIEAKWGASADALTGSGTLAAAIDAAEADSNIKYIQLQSNVTFASELEGIIASGEFTIDLNGKNVTSDTYTFGVRNSGTKVTFIDTAEADGKVSTTGSSYSAVVVRDGASVIIDGGQFEGGYVVNVNDSDSSATIKNGVFTSIGTRTIRNGGTLVIEGGSFTAGDWSAVCAGTSSVSTTVKGGSFTADGRGTIEYYGGLLDLSEYSEISGISVSNYTSAAVVPGDTTVKLPSGYCFYDSDNKAVASLEVNTKYTVGEGEAPELVIEAKWGASADALTGSGTLEAAIAAAEADSNIKYIQLQSDVTSTSSNLIESGEFTIDLNGKNVTCDYYTFSIRYSGTEVTFIDTADTDGKVSSTKLGACAVLVSEGASVIIDGGKFEGGTAVYVNYSSSSATIKDGVFTSIDDRTITNVGTLVIEGGSFTAGSWSAVCANTSTTIKGGSFTAGDNGTIEYYDGLLDLSEYSEISGISVYNATSAAVVPGDTTIKLPEGYCFYDGEEATTVLEINTKYTVGTAPETKYTVSFKANGGTGSMANDISYGKYLLPENAFTAPEGKEFASWLVGDTEYAPGDIIEITTDTAVSAVWQNVTAKITVEMTDSFGDGWGGNVLEVYIGEELVNSFTFSNGSSATASMNYDATKTYDFVWVKGYYPDECSFVIKVNGESVFTADRTACEGYENNYTVYTLNPKLELAGASITVGQDLTMNYLVKVLDTEAIDVTKLSARFTMNDKSITVSAGELRADGAYPFAFEKIAPQCMGDNIYAEILLDGKVIAVVEDYSVKENAQKLLSTYADDEKLVQLVTDMLYYGAAAQSYRGYKTDALVTDGVTGMVAASETIPATTDKAINASASETVYFKSASVWFDNINKIYVKLSTADGVTLKVNGETVELAGTTYYTDAIYAAEFDKVYTFELYEGEALVQSLTYSIKSYVYSMINGGTSNEKMVALAKALYAYGKSAETYKNNPSFGGEADNFN